MRIEHDIWLRARLWEGFDWAAETNPRLRFPQLRKFFIVRRPPARTAALPVPLLEASD